MIQTNKQTIVSLNNSQLKNPSHSDEDRTFNILNRKFKKKIRSASFYKKCFTLKIAEIKIDMILPGTYSNLIVFLALFCKNKVAVPKGENGHMFSNDRLHTAAGFALCSCANNEILEQ